MAQPAKLFDPVTGLRSHGRQAQLPRKAQRPGRMDLLEPRAEDSDSDHDEKNGPDRARAQAADPGPGSRAAAPGAAHHLERADRKTRMDDSAEEPADPLQRRFPFRIEQRLDELPERVAG